MNKFVNSEKGYIVFEEGGVSPIAAGASEHWYATYDEAMDRAIFLVRLNVESFKNRFDYNTVMVYEGEEKTLNESHGVPCGRVIFNWRNYK